MKSRFLFLALMALFFYSCNQQQQQETAETEEQIQDKPAGGKAPELKHAWATDSVLRTPESATYDPVSGVIYVSNVNGEPLNKDGNGFISRIGQDGKIQELKWITGLNAPKGIAIAGNMLYVTDIDRLVAIDPEKAKVTETYPVEGAKFLNDVAIAPDTTVYFSDSGTNKIHSFKNGEVSTWLEQGLDGPNGLLIRDDSMYVAMMNSGKFGSFSLDTKEGRTIAEGIGAGDGVVELEERGQFLVSNWKGEIWFIQGPGNKSKLLDTKEQGINSADIGMIAEQDLVLVPTFGDNRLVAYKLQKE